MLRKTPEIMSDAELAEFLARHEATENFQHHGNAVWWEDPAGHVVAVVFFDKSKSCKTSTYIEQST